MPIKISRINSRIPADDAPLNDVNDRLKVNTPIRNPEALYRRFYSLKVLSLNKPIVPLKN